MMIQTNENTKVKILWKKRYSMLDNQMQTDIEKFFTDPAIKVIDYTYTEDSFFVVYNEGKETILEGKKTEEFFIHLQVMKPKLERKLSELGIKDWEERRSIENKIRSINRLFGSPTMARHSKGIYEMPLKKFVFNNELPKFRSVGRKTIHYIDNLLKEYIDECSH